MACLSDGECQTVRLMTFSRSSLTPDSVDYPARMWSERDLHGASGNAVSRRTMAVGYHNKMYLWRCVDTFLRDSELKVSRYMTKL